MSGSILSGIGVAGSVGSILFADAGAVVIGGIALQHQEVPASIAWGGAQRLSVHKMPGGGRVIDAMGRDDAPISWSGRMIGPDNDARAFALDQLRIAGQPVPLQWGSHLFTVVVREFTAHDMAFIVEYSISCEVLRDEAASPFLSIPSLIAQVLDDVNAAVALFALVTAATSGPAGLPLSTAAAAAVTAPLGRLQAAAQAAGQVAAGDSSAAPLATIAGMTQAATTVAVSAADAQIAYINSLAAVSGNLLGTTDPHQAAANIATIVGFCGLQAGALAVRGGIGRALDNLGATSGATQATAFFQTVTPPAQIVGGGTGATLPVVGGNLFAIAAAQLGDATQWYRIGQASGLSDFVVAGTVTLTIPAAIQAPSDGVPALYGVTVI